MHSAILSLALVALGQAPDVSQKQVIDELIAKLGHRDYKVREQASKRLLEIGPVASDAIKAAQNSVDSEISDRCLKLYPMLWSVGLEKRLQAFVRSEGMKNSEELPLVKKWFDIVGDSKASRELYANMLRMNSSLVKTAEEHPERIPTILGDYAKSIYVRSGVATVVQPTGLTGEAEVSLFLFLGAIGDVRRFNLPGISSAHYYQFINSEWLSKSLSNESPIPETRVLFAKWLEKERYTTVMRRAIEIAAQHKLTECVAPLLKIAKDANTTPYVRATALLGLSRFGGKSTIKDLEPFFDDKIQIATVMVNNVRGNVQLRDVALGTALHLAGQSPKDFGFERESPNLGQLPPSYAYYAFSSDEKREAAHQKWREWAKAK